MDLIRAVSEPSPALIWGLISRGIGAVFAIAFFSIARQVIPIAGRHGVIPVQDTLAHLPASMPPLQRMLHLECRHFLADHNLNYTDRAGMAVGVEVRVPLLDLELVNFATRIPSSLMDRCCRADACG